MPTLIMALPILPGKEEPWRRFIQELLGSRLQEYEGFKRRLGLDKESVWLAYSRRQELAVAYLETEDPKQILRRLVASEEPFDVWFKQKLMEFHGCDLTISGNAPELIFTFPPLPREPARIFFGSQTEWTPVLPRREKG